MRLPAVHNAKELTALVEEIGFLPFFKSGIPGFSLAECCPPELWFVEGVDGPWEWKGPAARSGKCAYGKFFGGKAGYISREWFPDFANFRRDGYDFDARFDDELATFKEKSVYDVLAAHGSLLSKELKTLCHYGKEGQKGFDTVITRLQMQTYVIVRDFEYMRDKYGRPYGWGVARYTTPEAVFGDDWLAGAYLRQPEQSREKIKEHLCRLLGDQNDKLIDRLLRV
ncbi:MAG: AlkZ-related protein [Acutalibacteraceae bacterium]|jgi:hypothetical protein